MSSRHQQGFSPYQQGSGLTAQDSMEMFNLVTEGAFLVGVGGVSLAGGMLVGIGVLAAKGVASAARFFAGQAQERLKSAAEPTVDMNEWFDRMTVEENGVSRVPNEVDCSKVIDLLSNRQEEGVNYADFRLCVAGKAILETNEDGEVICNQFASPLSDPRIVSILRSAIKNRQEGLPVGSQALAGVASQIPNEQLEVLAKMVAKILRETTEQGVDAAVAVGLEDSQERAIELDEVEVDFPDFWLAEDGEMEEGDLERMEPEVSTESFMTEQITGIQRSQQVGVPNSNIGLG
jgi:hypothetical protein